MLHVVNKKTGFSPAEAESLRLRGHDDCSKTGQSGQPARRGSLLSNSRSGYIGEKRCSPIEHFLLAPDGNRGIAREPNSAPGAEESPIFIWAGRRGHILEHLSGVNPPNTLGYRLLVAAPGAGFGVSLNFATSAFAPAGNVTSKKPIFISSQL